MNEPDVDALAEKIAEPSEAAQRTGGSPELLRMIDRLRGLVPWLERRANAADAESVEYAIDALERMCDGIEEDIPCQKCDASRGNFIHRDESTCGRWYGCTVMTNHKPLEHHAYERSREVLSRYLRESLPATPDASVLVPWVQHAAVCDTQWCALCGYHRSNIKVEETGCSVHEAKEPCTCGLSEALEKDQTMSDGGWWRPVEPYEMLEQDFTVTPRRERRVIRRQRYADDRDPPTATRGKTVVDEVWLAGPWRVK